jgi:hypothetical protein
MIGRELDLSDFRFVSDVSLSVSRVSYSTHTVSVIH